MLAVSQARRARVLLLSMALVSTAPMFATPVLAQSMADTPTNEIVVTADRRDSFGADFVQAGTFRDARLVDTPLTVAIMTRSLLDAQQARSINDAVRNTAGVSQAQINTSIYSNLAVRGITLNNFTNVRWNGVLPVVNLIEQPIESLDRIEVLKGAAGLYYGFATPSGIVNLVTERPAAQPVTRVELQGDINGSLGVHADVSRRFGTAGLRLNAGTGILQTGVRRTDGLRGFVSAAFDWKPADNVQVLLDGQYIYKSITEPTEFSLTAVNGTITLPPLSSPRQNLGA
ncbi:MAG TPA: TonB-dependent receptor plug domain-containing protein, partial [Sphingomonas sanguinis]|uniref:TonB-dependent siderophore receptor n=1 Tax=Sphingomonas sanguinis TaxID=33051 RepID=UPI002ABFC547|nr:TonB-dependent receptor plug domain-containing protein [Sphingomonas sanguinis]